MYSEFYGFAQEAFRSEPDAEFYFDSLTHRKAMSYLGYGLKQGEGFIVVTGEPGSGKTMLVKHLQRKLDPNRVLVAALGDDGVTSRSISAGVAKALGLDTEPQTRRSSASKVESFLQEKARDGRRVLLVVDDCHRLSVDALEELRVLTNIHLGTHPLMQTLLLGQPEFKRLLSQSGKLLQLRERVIAAHNLEAVQPGEMESYVTHRLKQVGWSDTPEFHKSIWLPLHKRSRGSPRSINELMTQLLEFGAGEELSLLKPDMLADGTSAKPSGTKPTPPKEQAMADDTPSKARTEKRSSGGLGEAQLRAIQQAFSERDRAFERLRKDVATLRANSPAEASPRPDAADGRLTVIEARLDEQDAAMKQVLAALVEMLEDGRKRHAA